MKKLVLCLAGLLIFTALHAQWVDDPATNTFVANCGNDDGEIYLSTNTNTGDTYVQWEGFGTNGQVIRKANLGGLSSGVYIIQGLTSTGKLVTKKVLVNNE